MNKFTDLVLGLAAVALGVLVLLALGDSNVLVFVTDAFVNGLRVVGGVALDVWDAVTPD